MKDDVSGMENTNSHNWQEGKFVNSETRYSTHVGNIWKIAKAYISTKRVAAIPKSPIPLETLTRQDLLAEQNDSVYRLGHSTILIKLDGKFILIDPVFSERASPFAWIGPKRFHQSPIAIDQLPAIDLVIISHDHYDHLDKQAIQLLQNRVAHFLTPLGVGSHLRNWGIAEENITQLDWWQGYQLGELQFTATPAQHFSGRAFLDRDKTLWASWVIASPKSKLFFSGDSGYFEGFKEIGERHGPFDLTMIETGAYHELWSEIHMLPEQSVQAHIDLRGKAMMPIHNSTFDLALHDWHEPLERALAEATKHKVNVVTPVMGAKVELHAPPKTTLWWRGETSNNIDANLAVGSGAL